MIVSSTGARTSPLGGLSHGARRAVLVVAWIAIAGFSVNAVADIPDLARQAADNARQVALLVKLARAAEARGDLIACAAFAKDADRLAGITDLLRQEAVAEYNQLPPAQQRQVFSDKESVIADATNTRADADSIRGCLDKVYAAVALILLFIVILFMWLFWRAFGPFGLRKG